MNFRIFISYVVLFICIFLYNGELHAYDIEIFTVAGNLKIVDAACTAEFGQLITTTQSSPTVEWTDIHDSSLNWMSTDIQDFKLVVYPPDSLGSILVEFSWLGHENVDNDWASATVAPEHNQVYMSLWLLKNPYQYPNGAKIIGSKVELGSTEPAPKPAPEPRPEGEPATQPPPDMLWVHMFYQGNIKAV